MSNEEKPAIGNNEDIITRAPARGRITATTIEAIAALVSRGMTITEGCHQMNVRPKTFFNFTSLHRNDVRFKEIIEKFTAMRVDDLLREIERSAHGEGMKMRDWRAAKFLLEVLDRKRFNTDRPAIEVSQNYLPQSPRDLQISIAAAMKAYKACQLADEAKKRAQIIDVEPAKQLADAPTGETKP